MIIRWICKKCKKKWIYPIEECIYCNAKISKQVGNKTKVIGLTEVTIPSIMHPIVPYYTLILEDEHGNRMPKKTMREYKIGDEYRWEKSEDESAVSIIKIKYDFFEATKQAFSLIGDVDIEKDSNILIKPNIMAAAYPYMAITTNPRVVDSLIEYLTKKGASAENIVVAEQVQYGDFDNAARKSGFGKLCKKWGIRLVDLSQTDYVEKESGGFRFQLTKEIATKDLVINVPVMKTHLLLGISGALENMTRLVSKENYKEMARDPLKALDAIAHLHKVLPRYITLGDASIGMQGNGPLKYGEPAFLNMLLASKDPVALDKVFQEIGMLRKIPLIDAAERLGIGSGDLREIVTVGDELDACRIELKPAIGSRLIKQNA